MTVQTQAKPPPTTRAALGLPVAFCWLYAGGVVAQLFCMGRCFSRVRGLG